MTDILFIGGSRHGRTEPLERYMRKGSVDRAIAIPHVPKIEIKEYDITKDEFSTIEIYTKREYLAHVDRFIFALERLSNKEAAWMYDKLMKGEEVRMYNHQYNQQQQGLMNQYYGAAAMQMGNSLGNLVGFAPVPTPSTEIRKEIPNKKILLLEE